MTTKAKVIAGVVGGVLVIGGIGSAFNKDKGKDEDDNSSDISNSISQSVSNTDSEPEDSSKIYTIDEFCTRFENEDDFAHDHKDQIFTVSGTVDDKVSGTLYFKSSFESEKWHTDYQITCKFEDRELIEDITESANATISGKLFSIATSGIVLKDCTVVAFENPDNSSSSEESSESNTPEQSSESEQSNTTESELQSSPQEPESNSDISSVPSSVSVPESTSTLPESTQNPEPSVVQQKTYVLNTSTKKVHKSTCQDVDKIEDKNRGSATSAELDDYIGAGYTACGHCHPF